MTSLLFGAADPFTLLMAIVLMLMAASLVWWSLAVGGAVAPKASMCLAMANAFLAVSLAIDAMRSQAPPLIAEWGSDVCGMATFALLRACVPAISGPRLAWRSALLIWLLVGITLVAIAPLSDPRWHACVVYLGMSSLVLLAYVDAWRQLRQHLRAALSSALASPLFIIFMLLVARLVESLVAPDAAVDVRQSNDFNVAWLWSTLLMSLVLNSTMACLMLMRLVMNIQRLTERDPLTDAFNRRALNEAIDAEHARLQRGMPYALVMIDMDRFKQLNDSLGHAAGDAALRRLVAVLMPCVREVDRLGRLGGEEFCALLPLTDLVGALLVAERMRANLEGSAFEWRGQPWPLTASFGIAEGRAEDESADAVLGRADKAMYRAKAQGRNVVIADDF